ncbi:MAG: DUF2235 domain-containing protein [Methylococcales bacterium]|nr:DUF2235 domain-containing protein [Methylococcales bacterium]
MKIVYFSLSALTLGMFLQSCATASPDQVLQTLEKEKPEICRNFDYAGKDTISDSYTNTYKLWRDFDDYYDDVRAPNGRKLAVFLDGTNNDKDNATNIRDMYRLAIAQACQNIPVVPYYDKGVGAKWFEKIGFLPLSSGLGASLNIRQAYRFLSQTYKASDNVANKQGDEIYIFGFSRGAFTARSLNGFIEFAGLLDGTHMKSKLPTGIHWTEKFERMVDKIYDQYHIKSDGADLKAQIQAYEGKHYPEQKFDKTVKVKAIGVFDTVPALGFYLEDNPQNHKLDLYAKKGFHALALDEQRSQFKLLRFNKSLIQQDQLLSEVWFPGGHSNVGGGYANTFGCNTDNQKGADYYDSLETTPLNWMLGKFTDEQLFPKINPSLTECRDGQLHDAYFDSKVPAYSLSPPLPRTPVIGDILHDSVLCRMQYQTLKIKHPKREPENKYQPNNIPSSYTIETTNYGTLNQQSPATRCSQPKLITLK